MFGRRACFAGGLAVVVPEYSIRAQTGASSGELAYSHAGNGGKCLWNGGFFARELSDLRSTRGI